MLFKGSANPELAKEFLAFYYKDENYVEYIKSVPIHFFPITKSLRNSPAYLDIPMVKRWARSQEQAVSAAASRRRDRRGRFCWMK